MLVIFLALLTFVGWGSGDIFGVVATRRIGAWKSTFWVWIVSLVYLTAMAPFFLGQLKGLTWGLVALMVFLGVEVIASYVAFTEALRIGNASIVGTIAGSFVGLVVILSVAFLGEHLTTAQVIAIVVIICGLTLTSLNIDALRARTIRPSKANLLALLTMLGWGIYFTFLKIPVSRLGWFWPDYLDSIIGALFMLCFGLTKVKLSRKEARIGLGPTVGSAVISGGGMLTYNAALTMGSSAIVAPIAGAYPVLFVILSGILFKDPITRSQKTGMVVTLVGIVALAWFAS